MIDRNPHLKDDEAESLREFLEAIVKSSPPQRDLLPPARARFEQARERAWGGHRAEVQRVEWYVEWLRELAAALVDAPILVDSGQWEPIYDRPRSYADIEAEIASELVNLPKYHARSRLLHGSEVLERRLRTPEFQSLRESDGRGDIAVAIRDRTRRQYCAPLAEVLDRIARRSRNDRDQDDSATHRRVRL